MAAKKQGITQLRVGRLTKAHGLKGAIKLELFTDEPERRFVPGATFSLQVPAESPWHGQTVTLAELRWYNGHPVGFFEGVADRTAAETLVRAILWVDQDDAEELEPDTWYDHQLIGLAVMRDGAQVGTVARVDHLPAQDLIVVDTAAGEVFVPFVSAIVPTVDIASRTITVTPPLGLFEPVPDETAEAPATAAAEPADAATEAATAAGDPASADVPASGDAPAKAAAGEPEAARPDAAE